MSQPGWLRELTDAEFRGELDRVHPERARLRPRGLAGVLAAMDLIDDIWAPTIASARCMAPSQLHERVEGEYSFVESLRHLLFASDAWIRRMVMHNPGPFHEWGVPPDLPPDAPPDTGPGLEEVLTIRAGRAAEIRVHLATLSDDDLRVRVGGPWDSPGLPPEQRARVIDCFRVVFREEWWHHQFATRDLAVIESA